MTLRCLWAPVMEYVETMHWSCLKSQSQIWKLEGKKILSMIHPLGRKLLMCFLPRSGHSEGARSTYYTAPGEAQMEPAPQRPQDHTYFKHEESYSFSLSTVLQCLSVLGL